MPSSARPSWRRPAALAALVGALLAGCGTTVPAGEIASVGTGGGGLGGGTATGGAGGSATGTSGTTSAGTSGTALSPLGGSTSGGTSGTPLSGGTSTTGTTGGPAVAPTVTGGGPVNGRGFTAKVVKIGIAVSSNGDTFVGGLGLNGFDDGDAEGQIKAAAEEINKRGGLDGRKIQLVAHDYDAAQLVSDPARAHQAACATWTQDNKVLAVIIPPLPTENLYDCLDKARTPIVNAGIEFPRVYQATYDRHPSLFHLGTMVGELYDQLSVSRLVKRGYFTPWNVTTGTPGGTAPVKVGVIVRNDNEGAAQEKSIRAALAKHGITPVSVDHCTSTINASSCMQSVELRYQTNRITHVFGNSDLIFMNTANSQGYRPRYFMPGSLDLFAQNAPKSQLHGAMGENFTPTSDVAAAKDPGPPTPATTRCLAMMRKYGHDTSSSRLAVLNMLSLCDAFNAIEQAVRLRGGLYDRVIEDGLSSLGVFQAAETWSTRLSPQHHSAVSGLRDLVYDDAAGSFAYTSKTTWTS